MTITIPWHIGSFLFGIPVGFVLAWIWWKFSAYCELLHSPDIQEPFRFKRKVQR